MKTRFIFLILCLAITNLSYCQKRKINADSFYNEGFKAYRSNDYSKAYECLIVYKKENKEKFDTASEGSFYDKVDKTILYCYRKTHNVKKVFTDSQQQDVSTKKKDHDVEMDRIERDQIPPKTRVHSVDASKKDTKAY